MIFSIEKRRSRRRGKLLETRFYYLRYRLGDMPVDKWVSLGVTDFQVADKKAHAFIQEREREAAGIIEPKLARDAAQRPLREHLDDYEADLLTRGRAGRGGRGARLLKARILRLLDDCGWKLAGNVSADSFITWRNKQKAAARTLNHYLQGTISFLNWMERAGRIKSNPLKFVGKVDERGKKKRVRRAFTDEELRKLIAGSGPRGIVYFTAAATGLRQEELKQLQWGDVRLDAENPLIVVRAETAKNKREEPVYLMPEIAGALKEYRPAHWSPSDLVARQSMPSAPHGSRWIRSGLAWPTGMSKAGMPIFTLCATPARLSCASTAFPIILRESKCVIKQSTRQTVTRMGRNLRFTRLSRVCLRCWGIHKGTHRF